MSVQLNSDVYSVVAVKGQETVHAHGVKDTRWHTVERAAALSKLGYQIMDFRTKEKGVDKTDVQSFQDLLDRHGIVTKYAQDNKLVRKEGNGKAAPEKKLDLTVSEQEALAAPLRDLTKLSTYIGQQVVKGSKPIDSISLLATQAMVTLKTLGVPAEVIQEAFSAAYQPKK